jgi:hypothetical protein
MIRVRCEDFGSRVFISQFYRRQQSAGSFTYRNGALLAEGLGAIGESEVGVPPEAQAQLLRQMVIVCLRCDELQLTRL